MTIRAYRLEIMLWINFILLTNIGQLDYMMNMDISLTNLSIHFFKIKSTYHTINPVNSNTRITRLLITFILVDCRLYRSSFNIGSRSFVLTFSYTIIYLLKSYLTALFTCV